MKNRSELDDEQNYPEYLEYLDLERVLRALGDVVRLNMVRILASAGEMNVTDLAQMLVIRGKHISQPLVSWHLTRLRRSGLVRTRRRGRLVYCSLDRQRYQLCLTKLSELVTGASTTVSSASSASMAPPSKAKSGVGADSSSDAPNAFSGTLQGT